jgi:hypothetical protein
VRFFTLFTLTNGCTILALRGVRDDETNVSYPVKHKLIILISPAAADQVLQSYFQAAAIKCAATEIIR